MRSIALCPAFYLLWLGIATAGEPAFTSILAGTRTDVTVSAPTELVHRTGDRSVILHWQPVTGDHLTGYHVYRANLPTGPFEKRTPALLRTHHFVDVEVENGRAYRYQVYAIDTQGRSSAPSASVRVTPTRLDDEAFIDLVQQTAFDYFWYETNVTNGLVRDRNTATSPANIAAVGFGLSALTVGIKIGRAHV